MRMRFDEHDRAIFDLMLSAGDAGQEFTTGELAERLDLETKDVYRRCLRIAKALASASTAAGHESPMRSETRESSQRLYFFPATGEVLTHANHSRIDSVLAELRKIATKHPIPRGAQLPAGVKKAMLRDYRAYFRRLTARLAPNERQRVDAFERQLMAVMANTSLSDVLSTLGLRFFHPKVRTYKVLRGAPAVVDPKVRHILREAGLIAGPTGLLAA